MSEAGQPLISDEKPDAATPFRDMASLIDQNAGAPFGGAFVFVGPDGKARASLSLDSAANAAMFWSQVKTIADIEIAELHQQAARHAGAFRR